MPSGKIRIQQQNGCIILPFQDQLGNREARQLQTDLVETAFQAQVKTVILDFSSFKLIDSFLAKILDETIAMLELIGARAIFCGFTPAAAASLVDLGYYFEQIPVMRTVEDALNWAANQKK